MRPVKSSTLAFIREGRRVPGYTFLDGLHGYFYARWPYLYIGVGKGSHPLSKLWFLISGLLDRLIPPRPAQPTFADTYHGKVVPVESAARLVHVNEDIRITNLETIIPYATARDIILNNPQHIVVLDCPCRLTQPDPCLPLDVCLIIGDPFASFVEEHHARRSRRITADEAEQILRAEHRRGHVQHAFFKDAMLGRFYAICNCCECCCGAMQAHRRGTPMLAASGYISRVDPARCFACGTCAVLCPFDAISLVDDIALVDEPACMGCGVCVEHCTNNALRLERAPEKGEPLEILELMRAGL